MRRHSSAAQSACSAHTVTSPTPSASGLPWSRVMLRPISLARELAHLAKDAAALERGRFLPGLECLVRAREGQVQVGLRRVWKFPDDLVGRRVVDVLFLAAFALQELAVDVEAKVFVHAMVPYLRRLVGRMLGLRRSMSACTCSRLRS